MAITVQSNHGGVIYITGTTNASEEVTASSVAVLGIIWDAPDTDGHKLSIVDAEGNQLFKASVDTTNLGQALPFPFPHPHLRSADGLFIDDLDSGTVLIYLA